MESIARFLAPYEFSPTVLVLCSLGVVVYLVGLHRLRRQGTRIAAWRSVIYLLGVVLTYGMLQTGFDYWSQHMFFIHRGQHLVLHHIAPFLVALAAPGVVLAAGLPQRLRDGWLLPAWNSRPCRIVYGTIQQPLIAALLFVGLIYFWLIPSVHFYAMLNVPLYKAMNWSMAIDGFLFWFLMLDPRPSGHPRALRYGTRMMILVAIMFPQILIGAYIAFSSQNLYPVYAVCGRLWPITPLDDQHIGGLITWIPGSMKSVIGVLFLLRRWMREEASEEEKEMETLRATANALPARIAEGPGAHHA